MNVCVFGLGDLGCVTAACLARAGHRVLGVDCNPNTVDAVNAGHAPVAEPGLSELLAEVVGQGRLRATTDTRQAVQVSDIALICENTDSLTGGAPDLTAIERVAAEIGRALEGRDRLFTVLLRSTVLPGTTDGVLEPALKGSCVHCLVKVGSNPAFLREGSALRDFAEPPMILVGCTDMSTAARVRDLYGAVNAPFVETSVRTAELVRHASAAFLGLKICFANEIGNLSEALGADGHEVMRIFAMDHRLNLSDAYLKPGFAFSGASLPRDVRSLIWAAGECNVEVPLLAAIAPSNESQIRAAVDAVMRSARMQVAVVGFPYKPGVTAFGENPVATLVETLVGRGRDVRIFDRNVNLARRRDGGRGRFDQELPHIVRLLCDDVETLVDHADVLVVGRATRDAAQALALIGPDCTVIDLTRGIVFDTQRDDDADPEGQAPLSIRRRTS